MGILFALIAGIFMPLTNLTVRKSLDFGGNTKGYFVFQMLSTLICAYLFGPVRTGDYSLNWPAALMGSIAGVLLFVMLFFLGKSLQKGPPGFTFAILNSATVIPGILMAIFFGASLGYEFKLAHALGCIFVLIGLFWAGKGLQDLSAPRKWLFFSSTMFLFHVLLLGLYQGRGMLLSPLRPAELFSSLPAHLIKSECFIPCMFLTAVLIQTFVFIKDERRKPKQGEILYGFFGGLSNFLVTFFLLKAAQFASPIENGVIYPIFSVVGIILTNAWGQKLYQEQVNWRACQLCVFGLIVGTVDWKAVAAAIGF
jgi:multidrug transporter EmrE-like cation transporter